MFLLLVNVESESNVPFSAFWCFKCPPIATPPYVKGATVIVPFQSFGSNGVRGVVPLTPKITLTNIQLVYLSGVASVADLQ
jgi:hypothetical protein